jgi:uncharacterized protein (TIGR00369 family)
MMAPIPVADKEHDVPADGVGRTGGYAPSVSADVSRSRTVTWQDPALALPALQRLSGLDYLRQVQAGTIPSPPITAQFGITFSVVEPGRVVAELEPDEAFFNPLGSVHGGVACTLLDTVLACAGHTTLPAGTGYTSIDLAVQYLRPILPAGGRLTATGRIVKPGRRVAFTEGEITDAEGRVVATATSSLLVFQH